MDYNPSILVFSCCNSPCSKLGALLLAGTVLPHPRRIQSTLSCAWFCSQNFRNAFSSLVLISYTKFTRNSNSDVPLLWIFYPFIKVSVFESYAKLNLRIGIHLALIWRKLKLQMIFQL